MTKASPTLGGENHRRGISVTLAFLDEALCEFERWALGREAESVLYRERNTLSPAQRKALLAEIAHMRTLLRDFRDGMDLEPNTQEAAQVIWGRASGLREHLIELDGRHLKRYGAVSPELAAFVDPRVEALLGCLERIVACVAPTAPADPG